MKKISRELAKTNLSVYKIANTSQEEIMKILNSDYIYTGGEKEGENIEYNTIYDKSVVDFLIKFFNEIILNGVSNSYLKERMEVLLDDVIDIIGVPDVVYGCSCCGYLTLRSKCSYDICKLCGWEDDGTSSIEKYSIVNRGTLQDYKNAFLIDIKTKDIIYDKEDYKP